MKTKLEADRITFVLDENEDISVVHATLKKSLSEFSKWRGHSQEDEDTGKVKMAESILKCLDKIKFK